MRKTSLTLVALCVAFISFSQSKTDTAKKAILQVHLTNSKQQPLDKEEIIISSSNKKKSYRIITNQHRANAYKIFV